LWSTSIADQASAIADRCVEAQGTLPDAVIATWGRIWTFFEENPQIKRRFATDFEAYTGPESVAVCIGIR
jgi:predicted transcriptional regulator YdeE